MSDSLQCAVGGVRITSHTSSWNKYLHIAECRLAVALTGIKIFHSAGHCSGYSRAWIFSYSSATPYNYPLTLRRLMSYIYMEHPFLMFLDHTQRRSTVGRTPLDE